MMEFNAMSENLNISKLSILREKHKRFFGMVDKVKVQRNLIAHQYGMPASRLDWKVLWKNVNSNLPKDLLPRLQNVIQQEEKKEEMSRGKFQSANSKAQLWNKRKGQDSLKPEGPKFERDQK